MHGHPPFGNKLAEYENISRTIRDFRAEAKTGFEDDERRCAYIAAESWLPGAPPFCGAPVMIGSPYCAAHTRLCTADPASEEGARIALAQDLAARAVPPPALQHLAPCALPEPFEDELTLLQSELAVDARPDQNSEEKA